KTRTRSAQGTRRSRSSAPTALNANAPLARTQDESEPEHKAVDNKVGRTQKGVLLSERVMQTLHFLTPLPQDQDEGCDDYLNALGESNESNPEAVELARTQTPTEARSGTKRKKKKHKDKVADSGKFVRNTMDNVPTIT
ncbi:hypothetical protein COOONC_03309, partial [Cooperia oncophora]